MWLASQTKWGFVGGTKMSSILNTAFVVSPFSRNVAAK